jgi:sterol desaturase/sphingolipid hydroxylase (fatty acid hydroxylase superfamily)
MMLFIFAGLAAVFIALERCIPARPQAFVRRGMLADLFYIPANLAARVVVNFAAAAALTELGRRALPAWATGHVAASSVWVQVAAVVVVLDFVHYWTHRAKHTCGWWWRLHETHHSAREPDWLATVRFHPLEKLIDRTIILVPLMVLGAGESALVAWSAIDVFFGILNHANTRLRLGPLVYVFVGPEMHLWHHARDPRFGQVNFGNNLSIFDWMFGTAYVPDRLPEEFGVPDDDYPVDDLVGQLVRPFRLVDAAGSLRERDQRGAALQARIRAQGEA